MIYGILIYTKSNALMHFIDAHITELSATHGLVCSQQDKWRAIIWAMNINIFAVPKLSHPNF